MGLRERVLPNKHVRKALYNSLNDILPVYDTALTQREHLPSAYILLSSQYTDNYYTKCDYNYETSILIDVVLRYPLVGNPGSRVDLDDIVQRIIQRLDRFQLGDDAYLTVIDLDYTTESIHETTKTESIYRMLIRLDLFIT